MAILHRWCCAAHGQFDGFLEFDAPTSAKAPCPHGCDPALVEKVLGCNISVGTSRAKKDFIDRKMVDVANQFGVGDLDVRAGRSSAPNEFRWNEPEDVRRARLAGQTYSMPVDPKGDVFSQVGSQSTAGVQTTETNILQEMKAAGALKMNISVDPRMNDKSALPETL